MEKITINGESKNFYEFFEITYKSNKKEINKAYRNKALQYHPDKNINNKEAASFFQIIQKAYEILTNETTKEEYDKLIKAEIETKKRHEKYDNVRKKFKEDLEKRENDYKEQAKEFQETQNFYKEHNKSDDEFTEETQEDPSATINNAFAELNSKLKKTSFELKIEMNKNKEYDKQYLENILKKYGKIDILILKKLEVNKKRQTAIMKYLNPLEAYDFYNNYNKQAETKNWKVKWVNNVDLNLFKQLEELNDKLIKIQSKDTSNKDFLNKNVNLNDYETATLRRCRLKEKEKLKQRILEEEADLL